MKILAVSPSHRINAVSKVVLLVEIVREIDYGRRGFQVRRSRMRSKGRTQQAKEYRSRKDPQDRRLPPGCRLLDAQSAIADPPRGSAVGLPLNSGRHLRASAASTADRSHHSCHFRKALPGKATFCSYKGQTDREFAAACCPGARSISWCAPHVLASFGHRYLSVSRFHRFTSSFRNRQKYDPKYAAAFTGVH